MTPSATVVPTASPPPPAGAGSEGGGGSTTSWRGDARQESDDDALDTPGGAGGGGPVAPTAAAAPPTGWDDGTALLPQHLLLGSNGGVRGVAPSMGGDPAASALPSDSFVQRGMRVLAKKVSGAGLGRLSTNSMASLPMDQLEARSRSANRRGSCAKAALYRLRVTIPGHWFWRTFEMEIFETDFRAFNSMWNALPVTKLCAFPFYFSIPDFFFSEWLHSHFSV